MVAQGFRSWGCIAAGGALLGQGPLYGAPSITAALRWGSTIPMVLFHAALRPGPYIFEREDQTLVLGKLKVDYLLREERKSVYLSHFDCCRRWQTDKTRNHSLTTHKNAAAKMRVM